MHYKEYNSLERLQGFIFIKDVDNHYLYSNDKYAHVMSYPDQNDLLGLTDEDASPHGMVIPEKYSVSEYSHYFKLEDERAFRNESFTVLDIHNFNGNMHVLITYKRPYYDDRGKVVGAMGQAIAIESPTIATVRRLLHNSHLTVSPICCENAENFFGEQISESYLSDSESQYIEHIAQGFTAKQIASKYSRSVRTIETHLDNAREKLQCNNRTELVAKALALGLIEYRCFL